MKKNSTSSSETSLKQNEYVFSIDDQRTILISSCFESGNIVLVKQVNELNVKLSLGSTYWKPWAILNIYKAKNAGFTLK